MNKQNNRVFILMDGGHDYSAAQEFGDIVMVNLPPSASYDTAKVFAILREQLRDVTENDYILLSGLTTFCCIATCIAVNWCGCVNLLLFSDGKYLSKSINFDTYETDGDSEDDL